MKQEDTLLVKCQEFLVQFGQRVEAARLNMNLTQEHVAAALELTPQALTEIERGLLDVEVTTVAALARLLKTPISELLELRK